MKKIVILISFVLHINMNTQSQNKEVATLGAGCFWCVEAVYDQLEGVISVESGYSGGTTENPTYKEVCTGTTNHAEVCQITFDPDVISFGELLTVFWSIHNPTTLNRQGADIGTQYRSAVFYHSEKQKEIAEKQIELVNAEKLYDDPIVTEVTPFEKFYQAEDYHQEYFENNPENSYCRMVVGPKVEKFQKLFKDQLKK
ncbi:peptide-methionine (S)-S-oxide reductase MsrA [Plebeiibacterium sediminum]|uniref:Peptide methionine sulfoxide reductase MsrA n=1 Tax=Plebeiibacterium sediminum TaxID=2992112 RepID=A0AAE3M5U1_9BACT|nr:peptide-methionine (S)-S-oxide reductase MsrA [Plebeiobacterium sediminum]MCW3787628.1 peptide-methionine (S)-S-oxide reductase MsrA [Plebeiobacterium sediminum]